VPGGRAQGDRRHLALQFADGHQRTENACKTICLASLHRVPAFCGTAILFT
jgi:hypothetical protein